jgi:hypothetical protein
MFMSEAKQQYSEALKDRRQGIVSKLGASATFLEVKPDFYADSRILSEDALKVFESFKRQYKPYGLVDPQGGGLNDLSGERAWRTLTRSLAVTAHRAFEEAEPSVVACPYHEALSRSLGGTRTPLRSLDGNVRGLDTLRHVVTPGGELNAPLFTSLIRRLPDLQRLHGGTSDPEEFARNSVTLLREPLAHPQQWAVGFVYSRLSAEPMAASGWPGPCRPRTLPPDSRSIFPAVSRAQRPSGVIM